MRESIGGISIFQIVIVFVLLFAAIISLTINHSKAIAVKDEIINIIEKEKKVNVNKIASTLTEKGYRITGRCPEGYTGYDRNGNNAEGSASFCIKENSINLSQDGPFLQDAAEKCYVGTDKCFVATESDNSFNLVYYDIRLFYQLDIPLINSLTNFTVNGSTKILYKE